MIELLRSRLAPFKHVAFRRFFIAQTLSLSGSWASDLARAWIVVSQFGSATALGGLMLASALPGLFLMLHGGVLIDRVDVRRLMIITKTLLGFITLGLALLTEFGHIAYWHLLVFGFLEGVVNAFDAPAFQAFIVRLVPRQDFQQALALNSTNFHFSRMLGPAIAGGLMAWKGPSIVFAFDCLTYFVVAATLASVSLHATKAKTKEMMSAWSSLWEGIMYMIKTPIVRFKVLQLLLTISLVFPLLVVVFRTYMKVKFNLDAQQFGFLFTLPALGSMMGALTFAAVQPKVPIRALRIGVPGAGIMMLLVPQLPTALAAAIAMAFSGFFMYLTFASLTVSLQLELADEFRGRVSSVVGLCFVSIGPLMGFPVGNLADRLGFAHTIEVLTIGFVLVSAALALLHRRTRLQE